MSLTKWSLARNQSKVPLYNYNHSKYLYGYNYQCLLFFTIFAFTLTLNDCSGSSPSHPYLVAVPACKLNSTQNIHSYKFWLRSSMSHVKFSNWNVNKADSRVFDSGMIIDRPLGLVRQVSFSINLKHGRPTAMSTDQRTSSKVSSYDLNQTSLITSVHFYFNSTSFRIGCFHLHHILLKCSC